MNAVYKVVSSRTPVQSYEHLRRRLFVAVRNEAINHWRLRKQHQKALAALVEMSRGVSPAPSHASSALEEEICRKVAEAIAGLSPQRQLIIRLYFFEGKSTIDIATDLGLSKQTVLNQKATALKQLLKSSLCDVWCQLNDP